ncbi:hypothetical protein [Vibrio neptunius]|uniref:hypothetical protein n=1 Tax=Vibrio neptunius TaxID=170651 RepID=UPI0019D245E1|nr:hypothetical protein [Vibrio neptunius]MBN3575623.1 hypothetical protein [Vibrio neptunius]QXX05879.1 hypothetical protein KW548_12015 [Vibrio neptunius]
MYKIARLGMVALLVSGLQIPVGAQDTTSNLDNVLVYVDEVGGPYTDTWYVRGDLKRLSDIDIVREGKSGSFEATVEVDCRLSRVAIKNTGLLFTSIVLTKEESAEYISDDVTEALVKTLCSSSPNIQQE